MDIKVIVVFQGKPHDIVIASNATFRQFREKIYEKTNIPHALQKIFNKGQNLSSKPENDDKTLQELAIVANSKLMLMGSEPAKVIEAAMVSTSSNVSNDFDAAAAKAKEVWSEQDTHKKIIEKGIPTDAEPGELNRHAPVLHPISNLLNNRGTKVRLTLKTDTNEVWINSAASTQKYPMGAIREVQSQPIKGHEQYHLMYFQMGKDDSPNLRLWFYWVPAQYVRAIRGMILGTWF